MSVDDIIQLEEHFTFQGNPNQFTWHFKVETADSTDDDVLALATKWSGVDHTDFLKMFEALFTSDCIIARKIHPTVQLPAEILTAEPGTRPVGTDALPGQCCMLIQMLPATGQPTQRRRGRDYVTGRDDIDHQDGIWNQAGADQVLNFYNDALGGVTTAAGGGEYRFGVWSQRQLTENENPLFAGSPPAQTPPDTYLDDPFTIIDTFRARARVRTQRRRQPEAPCGQFIIESP